MKFSLATITLCALSMSGNTNAALFRGTARRELQAQGFTTEQVTVDENTSTVGIPNCTPGQRVQFNNASGQWECFNPLGGVVVGQGTPTQDIPEDVVDDVSPTDSGATIIQPGGTTTVQEGPTSPSITTPEMVESSTTTGVMPNTAETVTVTTPPIPGVTPPQVPAPDNSVAANGITTPSGAGSSGVVTTGLASCTSGQRAVFNAALQMWECDNNNAGSANVVTLNGNAVGGGNVVTVGTPNTSNQPAFAAAASGDDSKDKKDKKSKDDSNDSVAVNPATAGNAAMEGTVPTGVGCAAGQSSVYVPGEGEWRCVASARSSNPDMEP